MRAICVGILTSALVAVQLSPSLAQSSSMQGESHASMMTAHCPAGDPAVIVDTMHKTYMMDTAKARAAMRGMTAHRESVCESKAVKMGAKMASAHAETGM